MKTKIGELQAIDPRVIKNFVLSLFSEFPYNIAKNRCQMPVNATINRMLQKLFLNTKKKALDSRCLPTKVNTPLT